MRMLNRFSVLAVFKLFVLARGTTTSPIVVNQVQLDGITYINKGLVAFGLIPSDFRDSNGDTIGGISSIALKPGSWNIGSSGQFTGTLFAHPDRDDLTTTVDYQARQHEIDFILNPYYDSNNLDYVSAQKTLTLQYKSTTLLFDVGHKNTTGLNPNAIREPSQAIKDSFPGPLPIVSSTDDRLALDIEGMVANADGTFWVSDEYAPGIYRVSSSGEVVQALLMPDAIVPRDEHGNVNFTSEQDPKTGRAANDGFEGLTIDPVTGTLYAILQSATVQDRGNANTTLNYTRLFAFDVQGNKSTLTGEWIIPLPHDPTIETVGCNEILYVGHGIFLAVARDRNGRGGDGDGDLSRFKRVDLFSIRDATDIHGSKFDSPENPVSPNGKLHESIKPGNYVSFINVIDDGQLARFGLHNGLPSDETLINAKWESLTIAPVGDPDFPDDYFIFSMSDNDFLTIHGVTDGEPYDAGIDTDHQVLVFRVTLPDIFKQ